MLAVQGKNYLSQFQWLSSVRCSGRVAVVRQHLRELSGFWSFYIHNPSGGHRCRVRDSWGRPSLTSHHHIGFSSWGSVCYAWLLFCIPLNYLFWATLCLRPSIPKIQTFAKTPNPKMDLHKNFKFLDHSPAPPTASPSPEGKDVRIIYSAWYTEAHQKQSSRILRRKRKEKKFKNFQNKNDEGITVAVFQSYLSYSPSPSIRTLTQSLPVSDAFCFFAFAFDAVSFSSLHLFLFHLSFLLPFFAVPLLVLYILVLLANAR